MTDRPEDHDNRPAEPTEPTEPTEPGQPPTEPGQPGQPPTEPGQPPAEPGHAPDGPEDRLVTDAFAAFRDSHRAGAQTPPVQAVFARATHQQRVRRYRTALATAAAMVLVVGTGAALGLVTGDAQRRQAGNHPVATDSPSPSASPSPSKRSPRPDPTKQPRKPALDPREIDLAEATVRLAALADCTGGELDFAGGAATDSGGCGWGISAAGAAYGDVDGARGQEIVTTVTAGETTAVVGIKVHSRNDLDGMDYALVAEGQQRIDWVSVSGGTVSVGVTNTSLPQPRQKQTRSYRWAGADGFVPIGSPSSSPDEPDPSGSGSASPSGAPPGKGPGG